MIDRNSNQLNQKEEIRIAGCLTQSKNRNLAENLRTTGTKDACLSSFPLWLMFHLLHDKKHGCQHSLSTHLTASAIQNERRRMVFVPVSKIPEKDSDWPGYGIRRSGSLTINVRKGRWFNSVWKGKWLYYKYIHVTYGNNIHKHTHSCRKPKIPHFVFLNLELKMLKNSHQNASLRQAWFIPVILS